MARNNNNDDNNKNIGNKRNNQCLTNILRIKNMNGDGMDANMKCLLCFIGWLLKLIKLLGNKCKDDTYWNRTGTIRTNSYLP